MNIKHHVLKHWKSMCNSLNDIARNIIHLYLFFIFIVIDKGSENVQHFCYLSECLETYPLFENCYLDS